MNIDLYCDESRQDLLVNKDSINLHNQYVCIGGLLVPREKREALKKKINAVKEKHNIVNEFKWGNVSNNKLDFYLELIDLFFDDEFSDVCFRCIVIDASVVDNDKYNNYDQELAYYKFYYLLLHNWLNQRNSYFVFTDFKTNKEKNRLRELKRILNLSLRNDNVELIQAINSKESVILQLENIVMGAVAYKYNFGKDGLSTAKKNLVEHVEKRLGHEIASTRPSAQKFNVFKIQLNGGRK